MNCVFGPVPSRRLGRSLGIDTIPLKTCNWNCVYCQLGRTKPLTNIRREYYPTEAILAEAQQALASHAPGEIDWVTFVGSGEPMLHNRMGELLRQIKSLTNLPVAVITNGSLLYMPEIRQELLAADAVLPTLDAGTAPLFRQINRPHPHSTFQRLVDGLVLFRQEYHGKLWVEVMLVRGMNDTPQALGEIAKVLQRFQPDAVHINLPDRPPVEAWVQPPPEENLLLAMAILGDVAEVVHPAEGTFNMSGSQNLGDAILAIITRHPMRQDQLDRALQSWSPGQVRQMLADLTESGRAIVIERYGTLFWSAAGAYFPDTAHSLRTKRG